MLSFLLGIEQREGYFVVREHEQLRWRPLNAMQEQGTVETGQVAEQAIEVLDETGQKHPWRRIRVRLNQPTRDGDDTIYLLSNLPPTVPACTLATVYRKRWTIETAFQQLERNFNSEINTLAYPKAALFGFCVALVAYNTLAVLQAALLAVHGAQIVEQGVSSYYLAAEISTTYRGMMIAIPSSEWVIFRPLNRAEMAELLIDLAQKVPLAAFKKHRRGPKKPSPRRAFDPKHPHVATAKLIAGRRG